jgi:hypothetical protein
MVWPRQNQRQMQLWTNWMAGAGTKKAAFQVGRQVGSDMEGGFAFDLHPLPDAMVCSPLWT